MTGPSNLVDTLDAFYLELMEEARSPISEENVPTIGFNDKLKLFSEGRAWVAVRNKVSPDESDDPFSEARNKLVGRARGSSASPKIGANGRG